MADSIAAEKDGRSSNPGVAEDSHTVADRPALGLAWVYSGQAYSDRAYSDRAYFDRRRAYFDRSARLEDTQSSLEAACLDFAAAWHAEAAEHLKPA